MLLEVFFSFCSSKPWIRIRIHNPAGRYVLETENTQNWTKEKKLMVDCQNITYIIIVTT
jgi:hypothetical protein